MKFIIIKFTLNQLILSGVHLGHPNYLLQGQLKPYLIGTRNKLTLINLQYTSIQLQIILNLIVNIISLRQKLLILDGIKFYQFRQLLRLKYIICLSGKMLGGILTNFKCVRRNTRIFKRNKTIRLLRFMPSLVITLNTSLMEKIILESKKLNIPVTGILDINSQYLNSFFYPIIGNEISLEASLLYIHLLRNSILKGLQKERLNILSLI